MARFTNAEHQAATVPDEMIHKKWTENRVLIIVPAYNEAQSLPGLIGMLQRQCAGCDIVVIDDGSTDGTRGALTGRARVVSLPCNLGIGAAVQTGLQIAIRENYDCAVQVDADGQHPPHEVANLLRALGDSGCDLVVGSRFRTPGGYKSTAARRLGIRLFSSLLSRLCRTAITDPTSGFRAMNRRAIRVLASGYAEDYPEVEALVLASRSGLRIMEIPVEMSARLAGKSSIAPLQACRYMLKVPLAILMSLLRKRECKF
jgi:glycosyltransferase involved in cell wall biosynthesis